MPLVENFTPLNNYLGPNSQPAYIVIILNCGIVDSSPGKRMMMAKNRTIVVKGIEVNTFRIDSEDYISLTDIARNKNAKEPKDVVKKLAAVQNYYRISGNLGTIK